MISDLETQQWREKGFVVVKNLLDPKLISDCTKFMNDKYPDVEHSCKDFGSNGELEFPSGLIIDQLSISEPLIDSVKKLLGTERIILVQSDAWSKGGKIELGKQTNKDQRMHMDYGNNMFLHPGPWEQPEAVSVILYLSDTNETGGQTAVVPREGENDEAYQPPYINMPGQAGNDFINDRKSAEEYFLNKDPKVAEFRKKLYDREIYANADVGDILFYRLDIWHRGTPVKEGKVRNVVNIQWRKKDCYWINTWNPGWSKNMYYGIVEKLIISMTPKQRDTIGIPPVDDPYWTEQSIAYFEARYPGIDVTPYKNSLKVRNSLK